MGEREVLHAEKRAVTVVFGGVFSLILVAGLSSSITKGQTAGVIVLGALIVATIGAFTRITTQQVVADERGIAVRNFFGSQFIAWPEIDRFEVGWAQWAIRPSRRSARTFSGSRAIRNRAVGQVILHDGRIFQMTALSGTRFYDPAVQVEALNRRLGAVRGAKAVQKHETDRPAPTVAEVERNLRAGRWSTAFTTVCGLGITAIALSVGAVVFGAIMAAISVVGGVVTWRIFEVNAAKARAKVTDDPFGQ